MVQEYMRLGVPLLFVILWSHAMITLTTTRESRLTRQSSTPINDWNMIAGVSEKASQNKENDVWDATC